MRYLFYSLLFLLFIPGCGNTPTPQSKQEIAAQKVIAENREEAQKAQAEYLALRQKRRAEGDGLTLD